MSSIISWMKAGSVICGMANSATIWLEGEYKERNVCAKKFIAVSEDVLAVRAFLQLFPGLGAHSKKCRLRRFAGFRAVDRATRSPGFQKPRGGIEKWKREEAGEKNRELWLRARSSLTRLRGTAFTSLSD